MTTNRTSSAPNQPRLPTQAELQQLADWLFSREALEREDAQSIAEAAYIAVYDDYCTGGPGFAGKVMSVVWDGAPSSFDVFTWRGDQMQQSGRDYDERRCEECGQRNGTLCYDCWRQS